MEFLQLSSVDLLVKFELYWTDMGKMKFCSVISSLYLQHQVSLKYGKFWR
jgi:hypothetical protein